MSAARPTIAVLGTGRMGAPMARNLLDAGFPLSVWDHSPEHAEALADAGARHARTPADAARDADVVLTMLPNGPITDDVMSGSNCALASMRPGSVWLQMATVGLEWTDRLARRASEHEIEYVDAPVSGSDGPARDGELVVLASGPDQLHDRLDPIFDAVGKKTLWLGPAGKGSRFKLVLNTWLVTLVEGVAETIALAEALGLDPDVVPETLVDSPLGSAFAVGKSQAMVEQHFEPGFALRLAFKDVGLAIDAAHSNGLDLPITNAIAGRWSEAMADGLGDEDVSTVIKVAGRATEPAPDPQGTAT
jgi:3-hydroxyisobutyrate dehydrogenase